MCKKKLFLFTEFSPFGPDEKTFVLPELSYITKEYDVEVLSSERVKKSETEMDLDFDMGCYPKSDISGWMVLKYVVPFLLYPGSWSEIFLILRSKKKILERLKKIFFFFANSYKFFLWLKENEIIKNEEVIAYSYWHVYRVLGLILLKKENPNIKVITRAHGYDLYKERNNCRWQPFKKHIDKYIDKVIFISKHGYEYYVQNFVNDEYNPDKYAICRIGTLSHCKEIQPKKHSTFLLVSCSNVVSVKRVDLIIDALGILEGCNIEWVHYGSGEDFNEMKEYADRVLQHRENITFHFMGYRENEEIMESYAKRKPDCFIMTSLSEGSPVAMQEAISFGIPVIGTNVGGIPEMIAGNGYLLNADPSKEEVAEAIRKLYFSSDADYAAMQKKSIEIWEEDYNLNKNMNFLLKTLDSMW